MSAELQTCLRSRRSALERLASSVEGVAAAIRDLAVVDPPAPILPRPLQYLSIPECAKRLSCSKQFVYRLIHDGLLRSMKDSIWRVSEQDLEAYAESQRYNPKSTSR